MKVDYNIICRTCLVVSGVVQSIYDTKISTESSYVVADILRNLATNPPSEGDGMPGNICTCCLRKLRRCYMFKMECDMSDKELRRLLNMSPEPGQAIQEGFIEKGISTLPKKNNNDFPDVRTYNGEDSEEDYEEIFDYIDKVHEIGENVFYDENSTYNDEVIEFMTERIQLESSVKGDESKHSCPKCKASFPKKTTLNNHLRTCRKKKYYCPQCPKVFVQSDKYEAHVKTCQYITEKCIITTKAQCSTCNHTFLNSTALENHKQSIHNIRMKSFGCPVCKKRFPRKHLLRVHSKRHVEKRSFQCEQCPWSFYTKKELSRHVRAHTGVRPYMCHICEKTFVWSSNLRRHLYIHTGERPHACKICGKQFNRLYECKRHMATHKEK